MLLNLLAMAISALAAPSYQVVHIEPDQGWDVKIGCGGEIDAIWLSSVKTKKILAEERTIFTHEDYTCLGFHLATYPVPEGEDSEKSWAAYVERLKAESEQSLELADLYQLTVMLDDLVLVHGKKTVNLDHATVTFYQKYEPWKKVDQALKSWPEYTGFYIIFSDVLTGIAIPGPPPTKK